jgi:hypothetical protein
MTQIINITHETGDLTQYTSTAGSGLSASAAAALGGTGYGLAVVSTTNALAAGRRNASSVTGLLRLRFYFDPNSAALTNAQASTIVLVSSSSGAYKNICGVEWQVSGGQYQLRLRYASDTNGTNQGTWVNIADAPHYVELNMSKATTNVALDGIVQMWIDGVSAQIVTGIDIFDDWVVSYFRMGLNIASTTVVTGTVYFDELVVNDSGALIGPIPPKLGMITNIGGTHLATVTAKTVTNHV